MFQKKTANNPLLVDKGARSLKVDKCQGGGESAQVDKKIPTVNIIYLKTLRESQKGAPRTSHRLSSCFYSNMSLLLLSLLLLPLLSLLLLLQFEFLSFVTI